MPTTAELLAALPAEDNATRTNTSDELERIFHALANRPVPTGTLNRFCSLGGLSAKLGLAYLAYWIRTWYLPDNKREKDLLDTNLRAGLNTLETMGYLRGAVAKLGQTLTAFPESVPEGFVETLSSLHFQAPPMHFALIREQLLSELGDPEDVFAEFDEQAVAAASIGQVHRARLKSGEEVAVKIQYPGIARTIRADLRSLKTMMRPFLFNDSWRAVESLFDELRVGLEAESSYEQEAQNLAEMGRLFESTPEVVVPSVFEEYSTNRVLTMEFLEGQTFDKLLATNPSQDDRDHYGYWISRAIYQMYQVRSLYSDTHPGNFIFMPGRRLGLIDFGNLRRFNDEEWKFHVEVYNLRHSDDEQEIRRLCADSAMMTQAERTKYPEVVDLIIDWLNHFNEPLVYEGKFDYGDIEFQRRGAELLRKAMKVNWVRQKPQNMFAHRLNFALPALLYQLKSRVNVPELVRDAGGLEP